MYFEAVAWKYWRIGRINTHRDLRKPKSRALCIAIRYFHLGEELRLTGSHCDPFKVRDLLVTYFGYNTEDIVILLDDSNHIQPTRENILKELANLVADAHPGDRFFFHYSGHATQIPNLDGKEKDGFDEVIWPADIVYDEETLELSQYIIDDDIKRILVDPLPDGARLTALLDCCHSGTMMDLPHNYPDSDSDSDSDVPLSPTSFTFLCGTGPTLNPPITGRGLCNRAAPRWRIRGGLNIGPPTIQVQRRSTLELLFHDPDQVADVISWSACMDDQLVVERDQGGIMVEAFVEALRKGFSGTNRALLTLLTHRLAHAIKLANKDRTFLYPETEAYKACPQLSSLKPLGDVLDAQFVL